MKKLIAAVFIASLSFNSVNADSSGSFLFTKLFAKNFVEIIVEITNNEGGFGMAVGSGLTLTAGAAGWGLAASGVGASAPNSGAILLGLFSTIAFQLAKDDPRRDMKAEIEVLQEDAKEYLAYNQKSTRLSGLIEAVKETTKELIVNKDLQRKTTDSLNFNSSELKSFSQQIAQMKDRELSSKEIASHLLTLKVQ